MTDTNYDQDMTKARYVSANLTPDTANGLRMLTASMTVATGKRVTTSALVSTLVEWGNAHPDQLAQMLTKARKGTDDE